MFREFLPQNSTLTSDTRVSVSVVARLVSKYSQIFIRSTYIVISDFLFLVVFVCLVKSVCIFRQASSWFVRELRVIIYGISTRVFPNHINVMNIHKCFISVLQFHPSLCFEIFPIKLKSVGIKHPLLLFHIYDYNCHYQQWRSQL